MRRALLALFVSVVVVSVVGGASVASAAGPEWTIDVPAGWEHDRSSASAALTQLEDADIKASEADAYRGPDGSALLVFSMTVDFPTIGSRRGRVSAMEGIARWADTSDEVSYETSEHGNQFVVDQTIKSGGETKRIRRIYAVDSDGALHVASGTCASFTRSSECNAALDTLALTVPGESLAGGNDEMIVRIVLALGILGVLLGLFFLLTRRKTS
ncbi:MAG TPA: hypothetical protein VFQ53_42940 [Kofleriaceae bacterium]|nr:hypothetical protein [Kofleriaceae bacterium]